MGAISLRNVEKTGPYYHDGATTSLDQAVRDRGRFVRDEHAHEPAFADELAAMMEEAFRLIDDPAGESTYLRLSTRNIRQVERTDDSWKADALALWDGSAEVRRVSTAATRRNARPSSTLSSASRTASKTAA